MRRALFAGLTVLLLLGGGTALLLRDEDRAPLPSEDELRRDGFAVWPEDTLAEGMEACEEAEQWRLDAKETAFRFVREVLRYPEPSLNTDPIIDEQRTAEEIRYLIGSRGVPGVFLGMLIDVRKYDRCWFVVGAEPREGGWSATVSYVHPSGQPHVAIHSEGAQTQIGYGSWERSFASNKQLLFDISEVEPAATGHVMTMVCRQVCDASAWPLGFVPHPVTTDVASLTLSELARTRGICRSGGLRSRFRALVVLYDMTRQEPKIEAWYGGKPKIGDVIVKREAYFRRRGIEPLGGQRWSYTIDSTELHSRVIRIGDRCWNIVSTDDPARDVLRSLRVGRDSFTFDARWGRATSAYVSLDCRRGGDSFDIQRLSGPITVMGLVCQPLDEPFSVSIELRDGPTLVSHEDSWYRAR